MKLYTVVSLALFSGATIVGCSTPNAKAPPSTAWDAYQGFKLELNKNPDKPDYDRHLAKEWITMFDSAEGEEEQTELQEYASYPEWLTDTRAHYEKPSGDGLCLLVDGTAYDRSPGTLSVRYVRESSQLKATEIHYQYWENEEEFPAEAKCPDEFELELPGA